MQMSEWSESISACARIQASSSIMIASYRKSPPAPPYSSGAFAPRKPSSPQRRQVSRSVMPARVPARHLRRDLRLGEAAELRAEQLVLLAEDLPSHGASSADVQPATRSRRPARQPEPASAAARGARRGRRDAPEQQHGPPAAHRRRHRAAVAERSGDAREQDVDDADDAAHEQRLRRPREGRPGHREEQHDRRAARRTRAARRASRGSRRGRPWRRSRRPRPPRSRRRARPPRGAWCRPRRTASRRAARSAAARRGARARRRSRCAPDRPAARRPGRRGAPRSHPRGSMGRPSSPSW